MRKREIESPDVPVKAVATTLRELKAIVTHPAFRIGFLDRARGLPHDDSRILARIREETPAASLRALRWIDGGGAARTEMWDLALAQWRYSEGRQDAVVLGAGPGFAWDYPDMLPAAVRADIERMHAAAKGAFPPPRPGREPENSSVRTGEGVPKKEASARPRGGVEVRQGCGGSTLSTLRRGGVERDVEG